MGTPKYKQNPSTKSSDEAQESEGLKRNINKLLEDPKKLEKAIQIIEEMINQPDKKK